MEGAERSQHYIASFRADQLSTSEILSLKGLAAALENFPPLASMCLDQVKIMLQTR